MGGWVVGWREGWNGAYFGKKEVSRWVGGWVGGWREGWIYRCLPGMYISSLVNLRVLKWRSCVRRPRVESCMLCGVGGWVGD